MGSSFKNALRASSTLAWISLASATFLAIPNAAHAQSQPQDISDDDCDASLENCDSDADGTEPQNDAIVVTGSRIAIPVNLSSPVPVVSVSAEDLSSGNLSLGDTLNQLPQLRATFSQSNSTRFIGTAGINALDLRGLGTARTLTLVNGRRQITSTPGVERVDVNSIPSDLIERVDIVTGGNSAVYGSDAVAGVVNFVLNDDFDGIRLRGQGGISSRGDRGSYFGSITAGKNFAEGRGNVSFAGEYARQNTLFFTSRDEQTGAFSGRNQFNATEFTGQILNPTLFGGGPAPGVCTVGTRTVPCRPAETAAGNGVPDTSFLRGIRNNTISEGGLFTAACPTVAATGETAAQFAARRTAACTGIPQQGSETANAQFGRTFVFQPDGSLIANPCTTDLRVFGSNNCVGGLGSTLRRTGMLSPGLERYSATVLAHFEISPAFDPFIEARYVNVTANQEGQPTFFNNAFRIDNPFLTAQARNTLNSVLTPAQRANPTTTFTAQRFNVDFGGRGEDHERETYSIVGGVRGEFNDDWRYEVAVNYGKLDTYYETEGNLLRARYANAIDATRNAAGQIVCRINADASTTNDDPACVPVNLFGDGQVSQAALDYFLYTSNRVQEAELLDVTAFVAGDTSQFFEMPAGPIAFVIGGEYREQTAFAAYDETTRNGLTFLNAIADFDPPKQKVTEAFGEINIPIVADVPFIRELSLAGAARYSDYNIGQTGGVWAYNGSVIYAPIDDIKFRGGYARAVRAPTQSDLFSAATQTFINGFVDPCSQNRINDNPNRRANCAAAGVPTTQTFNGTTEPFTNVTASGISANNGGNPNLREERSESWTFGAVFEPRFLPGFALTVDYYDITIDNVIFALGGQAVINQCYDSPSGINNQYCAAVFRNPDGTLQGQQNVIQAGTTVSLTPTGPSALIAPFNFAKQETSGVDADMSYRTEVSDGLNLRLRGLLSYVIKRNNYTDITDETFYDRQLGELGDPRWQGQISANLSTDNVDFGYRMRYIGKQVLGNYETYFSVQGRPPLNPDATPFAYYPDVTYHDFRVDFSTDDDYTFYAGVDNAFDKLPPLDLLGTEGGSPYGPVGRFFYAGAEFRF